jgi:hypothetical protein
MSIHITHIGKHGFVSGLFWQALSRPRELLKEARELGQKIDCDVAVVRKEYATAQAGFAQSTELSRTGLYSLASAVSHALVQKGAVFEGGNQPVHNWLGAFKLSDGKWAYFAVRDANFLPNGDFAGTRDEVFERLHGDYGLGGWNLVVGDAELEDYGFHHFSQISLDQLLLGKKGKLVVQKGWQLRPLKSALPGRRRLLGVAALTLLAGAAALAWQRHAAQRDLERQEAALAVARQMLAQQQPGPAAHPWALRPAAGSVLEACAGLLGKRNAAGWLLSNYECTEHQATWYWARQDSSVALLLAQQPDAKLDASGDQASQSTPLKLDAGGDEQLPAYQAAIVPLLSRLQLMHIKTNLGTSPAVLAAPSPPGTPASAVPPPQWQSYDYVL